jgi:hypothetical protein
MSSNKRAQEKIKVVFHASREIKAIGREAFASLRGYTVIKL